MAMKAMIFAAGLGTRLRPLTDYTPKALVKLGGIPMIERVILKLKDAGVSEMVVNVHHFASQVTDFLEMNGNFGIMIHISDESDKLLDTGGGILQARRWLDGSEPFIVHNADIYTDFDISAMAAVHSESGADVTLLVAHRDTSRYLLFDSGLRMKGWKNVRTGEVRSPFGALPGSGLRPLAFGGVHIVNPAIFPLLEKYAADDDKFSITPFYTDSCSQLDIRGYIPAGSYNWVDIGRIESLKAAESIVAGL